MTASLNQTVALWLHDQQCPCGRRPVAPAEDRGADHARRTHRQQARELICLAADLDPADAIGQVITAVHDWVACPAVLDKQTFPDGCGPDRERHLLWLAAHPRVHTLLRLLELADIPPGTIRLPERSTT